MRCATKPPIATAGGAAGLAEPKTVAELADGLGGIQTQAVVNHDSRHERNSSETQVRSGGLALFGRGGEKLSIRLGTDIPKAARKIAPSGHRDKDRHTFCSDDPASL